MVLAASIRWICANSGFEVIIPAAYKTTPLFHDHEDEPDIYPRFGFIPRHQGKEKFLEILHRYMEVHGTVYYETQRPPEVPAFVKNHGLLPQQDLQQLLRKAKVILYSILYSIKNQTLSLSLRVFFFFSSSLFFLIPVQLFIGFGFPYEGPAPLEAIANGCIFLQPKFRPPHSSLNHEFFRGKPTSREVSAPHGAGQ